MDAKGASVKKKSNKRNPTRIMTWSWKLNVPRKPNSRDECNVPAEFLCPISGRPMSDPVIVSSGQSFDRVSVQACEALGFAPILPNGVLQDLSSCFPNTNLKYTILDYYKRRNVPLPKPLDFPSACNLVSASMAAGNGKCQLAKAENSVQVLERPVLHRLSSSGDSSGSTTRTSSEFEQLNPEEQRFLTELKGTNIHDVEEALVRLRNITRSDQECRVALCTDRMMLALRNFIISSDQRVQANSVAALVNLSLEKVNKAKIARSGILPNLIDLLKGAQSGEGQELASAALFSLSLDNDNKAAIGALGALPPLLRALRSNNGRTRADSAAALYHLSLVRGNQIKLVKLGAVPALLSMIHSKKSNLNVITASDSDPALVDPLEHHHSKYRQRILLVLYNLGSYEEGRVAMMDASAIGCLIGLMRGPNVACKQDRVTCLDVLFSLRHGGLRFRGLLKAARGEEVLEEIVEEGKKGKEKAAKMLELMRGREEDSEEDVDWEKLLLG